MQLNVISSIYANTLTKTQPTSMIEIEISLRFISSLFLIPLAQSQLFRFRRNKRVWLFSSDCAIKCKTFEWRHPLFSAKRKWKTCKRDKSTYRDFVARSSASPTKKPLFARQNTFSWDSREVGLWQVYGRFWNSFSLVLLKLPRSCPKRILGNSAIPWQGKTPDFNFIGFFF